MLWVPQKGRLRCETNTASTGSSTIGTTVQTSGSSASIKGTAVQLIASTAFDAYFLRVIASGYANSTIASQGALDILIGSSPETVLIPDLLMGYCGGLGAFKGPKVWDFNILIPAGSRLAAQAAGNRLSASVRVGVYLYGGHGYPPFRVGSKVTTYGMTTVPNGTAITPGTSGAVGAFAEITPSTTEDHFAMVPSFQVSASTGVSLLNFTVEIGSGAATEEVVSPPFWYSTDSTETMDGPYNPMPVFQDIPAGTRLAMRASASGTPNPNYNGVIHAIS